MMLSRTGTAIACLAMAALGGLEAAHGEALPGLHAFPEAMPDWAMRATGVVLAVAALGAFMSRAVALALAAVWLIAFGFAFAVVLAADIFAWVPVAETAVFAAFALWRWDGERWWLLRTVFGAMLLVFGAVHVNEHEVIASLIPEWIPGERYWPWATGGVSLLAGLACLLGLGVRAAAGAMAIMYAVWLPVVHAPRIAADPSLFEWTFALTALALVGVALAVAGGGRRAAQS